MFNNKAKEKKMKKKSIETKTHQSFLPKGIYHILELAQESESNAKGKM